MAEPLINTVFYYLLISVLGVIQIDNLSVNYYYHLAYFDVKLMMIIKAILVYL